MSAYQLGLITGAIVAGAVIGLIPLICGIKKKKTNLAIGGLISCILAHFLLGLFFSIPCSIIFTIIICIASNNTRQKNNENQHIYNSNYYQ